METDYSKHTHFRWKIKWRLEHLGALGIMVKTTPPPPTPLFSLASSLVLFFSGYTLVFKAVGGNNEDDPLAVYKSGRPKNEHALEALCNSNKYKGHYKNRIVLDANWRKFAPSSVSIFKGQCQGMGRLGPT